MLGSGSSSTASVMNSNTSEDKLKSNSGDVGWEYGELINPTDLDKLKVKLCGHKCSGDVYRIKQHIAGIRRNVKACSVAKENDRKKCKAALDEKKIRKGGRRNKKPKLEMRSN